MCAALSLPHLAKSREDGAGVRAHQAVVVEAEVGLELDQIIVEHLGRVTELGSVAARVGRRLCDRQGGGGEAAVPARTTLFRERG